MAETHSDSTPESSLPPAVGEVPCPDDGFWNEIAGRLRHFIQSRVHDAHTAEDLVQDVLLKTQRSLSTAPMHNLSAWMFTIAGNVVIDHYRSDKHRRSDALNDETPVEESKTAVVTELSGCIRPMLSRLPDLYREALEQTDLGHLTQVELADQLGLSLPGLKSRIQRAREQLRTILVSCCAPVTRSDGSVVSHECECEPPEYCGQKSGKCG